MTLSILASRSGLVIPGYLLSFPTHSFGGIHHASPRGYIRAYDPGNRLLATMAITLPYKDTSAHALGLPGEVETDSKYVLSNRPRTYPYDPYYDYTTYGNRYLRGWHQVVDTFSGGRMKLPSHNNENNTRHVSYVGDLSAQMTDVDLLPYSHGLLNRLIATNIFVGGVSPQISCVTDENQAPGWVFSRYGIPIQAHAFESIMDALASFVSGVYPGVYSWDTHESTISGLTYSVSLGAVGIRYHVSVREASQPWSPSTMEWDTEINMVFRSPSRDYTSDKPTSGEVLDVVLPCDTLFTYTNYMELYQGTYYGPYSYTWSSESTARLVFLAEQVHSPSSSEGMLTSGGQLPFLTSAFLLKQFERQVNGSWGDILPSSAISTAAAVSNMGADIGINNVEVINELPGIVSVLPDVKSAIKILGQLTGKKTDLMTFKAIIDLATSTQLQASFVWRPYLELLQKYLPAIASALGKASLTRTLTLGYGTFSTTLNNVMGREQVKLLTKTKVVMDISLPSLMSVALTLDNIGVFPKFSRVWEVIPSSFILDWLFRVGSILEELETAGTIWQYPSLFVHTYKLFTPFSTAELASFKTTSSEPTKTGLKYFCRDVSHYISIPRPSKFGFDIPDNLPPLEVLGSLIYQKLF